MIHRSEAREKGNQMNIGYQDQKIETTTNPLFAKSKQTNQRPEQKSSEHKVKVT